MNKTNFSKISEAEPQKTELSKIKTCKLIINKGLPLQLLLIVPFVLQIFGAVGLVGYLSFRNGQKAVNELANQVMDRTSDVVEEHLKSYLSIPQTLNEINADAVRRGLLNVRDREIVGKYFWDQMQAYDLTYIGIGLTTGEGIGAARYDGKTITIDDWTAKPPNNVYTYATDNQGNRKKLNYRWDWNNFTERWYIEPIQARKPMWTKMITNNFPSGPYIAISASRPIYDAQNHLLGMIATDIHLLKLSSFLRNLNIIQSGEVFILQRDGILIATSRNQQPFAVINHKVQPLKAINSNIFIIRSITQKIEQEVNGLEAITEDQEFHLYLNGKKHFVQVRPWQDKYGLNWLVVITVPESTFMAQIDANTRTTIALSVAALVVACAIGVLTSRWIARPILRLNQASEAMASGDLDQTVKNSKIRELNTLSNSFNRMAEQLSELFAALEKSKQELEQRVEARTLELKDTLRELQRSQSQVIQNEKMSSLGQLVAGVAHEINNPVSFIHGNIIHLEEYIQNLLKFLQLYQQHYSNPVSEIKIAANEMELDFLQEDLPKIVSSIKTGTDRIRQIVLSLRNFSRMDEAEIKLVNIHEGIDSTLMILQHRLKAQPEKPEIELIKDYSTLPLVECYAGQLNQVFMNILMNAIDALEENNTKRNYQEMKAHPSQIRIRTSVIDAKWVEIAIADNGIGMSKQIQERIFDPFFTTKPIGKGTGLGMSISYQIVTEKHHGNLEVLSTLGEGTEFKIQIPIKQEIGELFNG
ncbi:ATP-binding protein [Aerosakkonema sp. BLCC-F183]